MQCKALRVTTLHKRAQSLIKGSFNSMCCSSKYVFISCLLLLSNEIEHVFVLTQGCLVKPQNNGDSTQKTTMEKKQLYCLWCFFVDVSLEKCSKMYKSNVFEILQECRHSHISNEPGLFFVVFCFFM